MTQDDIVRMAKEAHKDLVTVDYPGHAGQLDPWTLRLLERFAALVAAAEREKVARWMIRKSYATGHGDTVEDLLKEMEWQVAEREREACAKICDETRYTGYIPAEDGEARAYYDAAAESCAKAIRARGEA